MAEETGGPPPENAEKDVPIETFGQGEEGMRYVPPSGGNAAQDTEAEASQPA